MNTISTLGSSVFAASPVRKVAASEDISPIALAVAPVSAGASSSGSLRSMQTPLASALAWKVKSSDALTSLMTVNYGSKLVLHRFEGLGAAALQRFGTDASDFSQTVSLVNGNAVAGAQTSYQISLNIEMADGISVKVNLESQGNSLAMQISSGGKLSGADRVALSNLAEGFQKAIDGTGSASQPDFGALLQYDRTLVASIDFKSSIQAGSAPARIQTLHADQTTRSFKADGPDGQVNISVDLRRLAGIGSAQQRKAGLDAYLKQFEEAGTRGHANGAALATFKAAFQQMMYEPSKTMIGSARAINLSESDHALLTGLPDFSASVVASPVASNPLRPGEADTFSYQVSQDTVIGGRDQLNRSISQKRHAHLEASYHEALSAAEPLALDGTKESQNYTFTHVSEDRVSDTQIRYQSGILVGAATSEQIHRSTQVLKYLMGVLTDERTTPEVFDTRRDLLQQSRLD